MSLYNCKSDGNHYRISKFTNDLDVEASYLTSNDGCDCPAGHRPVCRHRIMLPRFIAKNAVAGQWFHNYEHNQWIRAMTDDEPNTLGDLASAASEVTGPDDNFGTGPMMEAVYDLRADQAKDVSPKPINLTATEVDERIRDYQGPTPRDGLIGAMVDNTMKTINLLELAKPPAEPLRFDKDYSNSIGHSPAHDALEIKPLRRL